MGQISPLSRWREINPTYHAFNFPKIHYQSHCCIKKTCISTRDAHPQQRRPVLLKPLLCEHGGGRCVLYVIVKAQLGRYLFHLSGFCRTASNRQRSQMIEAKNSLSLRASSKTRPMCSNNLLVCILIVPSFFTQHLSIDLLD